MDAPDKSLETIRASLSALMQHIDQHQEDVITEEGAKTAFILPFFQTIWGYNIFTPSQVMPEFNADVGLKKGEKVDYAILQDGSPVMIIECKKPGEALTVENTTQLFRYFTVTPARIGVLTNGIVWKFYSDTEELNKMDMRPFFEFSLRDLNIYDDDEQIRRIQSFGRGKLNIDDAARQAMEIKSSETMAQHLFAQMQEPSDEFVTYLSSVVYPGRKNPKAIEKYRPLVHRAMQTFIGDRVNQVVKAMNIVAHNTQTQSQTRLQTTQPDGEVAAPQVDDDTIVAASADAEGRQIVTTAEELEGYYIVKGILRGKIDRIDRVTYRDTLTYFSVVLDENPRKTLCRLYFNRGKKWVGLFDMGTERKVPITTVDNIYEFSATLERALQFYEGAK